VGAGPPWSQLRRLVSWGDGWVGRGARMITITDLRRELGAAWETGLLCASYTASVRLEYEEGFWYV
jgi:hypothetical protein